MDWDVEYILLCMVCCVSGIVELMMSCELVFDYYCLGVIWEYLVEVYGEVIVCVNMEFDVYLMLWLIINLWIGLEGWEVCVCIWMKEGDDVFVVLSWIKYLLL